MGFKYEIIESEYKDEVARIVIERLGQGWKLAGGVSLAVYTYKDPTNYDIETSQYVYAQAIWRDYE